MTAISDNDTWTEAPEGPANGSVRSSANMRSNLGGINDRVRWLFNRLTNLLGEFQLITAVDDGANTLTIVGHGLASNTMVRIESVGGSVPGGLSTSTVYYVIVSDADTIQLSTTDGPGAAVDITSAGSGTLHLFTVVGSLVYLKHDGYTTIDGESIPAASLLGTLVSRVLYKQGGTITGDISLSGTDARLRKRATVTLDGTADELFGMADGDVFYCDEPTAQRDHEVADADATNGDEIEVRRGAAGAFSIILHNEGEPAAICTLAASTCCSARLKRVGGTWTLLSYSTGVTPGADAG